MKESFRIQRMDVEEIMRYKDDPFYFEDIYQYMMKENPYVQSMRRIALQISSTLHNALSDNAIDILDHFTLVNGTLGEYTFLYTFSQGVLLAMKMFFRASLPDSSNSIETIMNLPNLYAQADYQLASRNTNAVLHAAHCIYPLFSTLIDQYFEIHRIINQEQGKYLFLFGMEYGLLLCKRIDPLFQDDEKYILELYETFNIVFTKK